MLMQVFKPSTQDGEEGFLASLLYTERPYLRKKKESELRARCGDLCL